MGLELRVVRSEFLLRVTHKPLSRHLRKRAHVLVVLFLQVFGDDVAVKKVNYPVGIIRICRGVGYHYDRCAFFI